MKILLTGAFNYTKEHISALEQLECEVFFVQDEREKLEIDVSQIDGVICNSLFEHNNIEDFTNLRFVQLTSAGLDRVPVKFIKKAGIVLHNAKNVYSIPMAEWGILKILEIYKKSREFYKSQNEKQWRKQREIYELSEKTVSLIGYGDVAKELSKRLKGFGVKVIGVGRTPNTFANLDEYHLIDKLEDVLIKSDVVILTLPYTAETHHLMDQKNLSLMKDKSILINISRGAIIDENALINTLKAEKFLGVALDVFENEPLAIENELWELDNVLITPHNSFVSEKNSDRLFNLFLNNIRGYKL